MENPKLNLYQKLSKIQAAVMGLGKDKDGPNGHYKYVTGNKLLGEIKPIMVQYGIILKQEIISIENIRQDYVLGNGKAKCEILSKVMMKFTWVDVDTGEKDENLFGANGQNDWDKGVGSAITYAERYFILKYFHIATDEDDIDNPDRKPEAQPEKKTAFTLDRKDFNAVHKAISEGARTIVALEEKFTVSDAIKKVLTSPYNAK